MGKLKLEMAMKYKKLSSDNSNHIHRSTSFLDHVVLLVLVLIVSFWVVDSQIGHVLNSY